MKKIGVGASNEQSDPNNVIETFEVVLLAMVLKIGDNTWIVDFGANKHVIGNVKIPDEVRKPIDQYNVKTGNMQSRDLCGQVDVNFYFVDGETKKISNVLYVLRFKKILNYL
jgi:hypothetical protein